MNKGFGPDELLDCYRRGVFPMADGRDDPRLFLVDPEERGIIPLETFHVPKRLARTVRSDSYRVTINTCFRTVIESCAAPRPHREETWINQPILELYDALHRRGQADSVECWDGDTLVGGLYGVRLGAAFFGESMFSLARDASKVALVHLVAHLISGDFKLLDAQFMTAHLQQFGTAEIPRDDYKARLEIAISSPSIFPVPGLLGAGLLGARLQGRPEAQRLQEPQYPAAKSPLGPGGRCLLAIAAGALHHHSPHN
jgi:leucyl/phenylalanyl-tRNA---protein transferase